MEMKVYSLFDCKAAVFANPFFCPNDSVALRGFTDAVNGGDGMLAKHPEDYGLHCVGSFDDVSGKLESCIPVRLVVQAVAVKRPDKQLTFPGVDGRAVDELARKHDLAVGGGR